MTTAARFGRTPLKIDRRRLSKPLVFAAGTTACGAMLCIAHPAVAQTDVSPGANSNAPVPLAPPIAPSDVNGAPPQAAPPPTPMAPPPGPPRPSDPGVGIALRVSTLGIGPEVSKEIGTNLALRIGLNQFTYSHNGTTDSVDYHGSLHLSSVPIFADLYPSRTSSFHLTPGIVFDSNSVSATGQPTNGAYTFNGTSYPAAEVGTLNGRVDFPNKTAPYVGLGFGNPAQSGSAVRFVFDLGAVFQGAQVHLSASGESNNPQLQQDVQAQQQKTQNSLNELKIYPVLSFGLAFHI
jgi:hypothetical protein